MSKIRFKKDKLGHVTRILVDGENRTSPDGVPVQILISELQGNAVTDLPEGLDFEVHESRDQNGFSYPLLYTLQRTGGSVELFFEDSEDSPDRGNEDTEPFYKFCRKYDIIKNLASRSSIVRVEEMYQDTDLIFGGRSAFKFHSSIIIQALTLDEAMVKADECLALIESVEKGWEAELDQHIGALIPSWMVDGK